MYTFSGTDVGEMINTYTNLNLLAINYSFYTASKSFARPK